MQVCSCQPLSQNPSVVLQHLLHVPRHSGPPEQSWAWSRSLSCHPTPHTPGGHSVQPLPPCRGTFSFLCLDGPSLFPFLVNSYLPFNAQHRADTCSLKPSPKLSYHRPSGAITVPFTYLSVAHSSVTLNDNKDDNYIQWTVNICQALFEALYINHLIYLEHLWGQRLYLINFCTCLTPGT